jgi:hypothetical protein
MNDATSFPSLPAMAAADLAPVVVPEGVLVDLGGTASANPSLADVRPVGPSYARVLDSPAIGQVLASVSAGNLDEEFPVLGEGEGTSKTPFPRSPKGLRKYQPVGAGENPLQSIGTPTGHLMDTPVRCPSRPLTPRPVREEFDLESHSVVTLTEFDPILTEGFESGESSESDESVATIISIRTVPTNLGGEGDGPETEPVAPGRNR